MKKRLLTAAAGDPRTLAELLTARLGLAGTQAVALVEGGAVQLDGRRASDPSLPIAVGARLIVHLAEEPQAPALTVVHEDEWLLIVDKPAGQLSQATSAEAASALDAQVRCRFADARALHRLDRDASGLVLFARIAEARAPLQAALETGRIERSYAAVVAGQLVGEGQISLRIGRDSHDLRRRRAHPEQSQAGEPAVSFYRALRQGGRSTAVALTLETGRTHQLRVHLSAIGHPILGDRLYGTIPAARLALHAERLALPHPRDGRPLVVVSTPPSELQLDDPP